MARSRLLGASALLSILHALVLLVVIGGVKAQITSNVTCMPQSQAVRRFFIFILCVIVIMTTSFRSGDDVLKFFGRPVWYSSSTREDRLHVSSLHISGGNVMVVVCLQLALLNYSHL